MRNRPEDWLCFRDATARFRSKGPLKGKDEGKEGGGCHWHFCANGYGTKFARVPLWEAIYDPQPHEREHLRVSRRSESR